MYCKTSSVFIRVGQNTLNVFFLIDMDEVHTLIISYNLVYIQDCALL